MYVLGRLDKSLAIRGANPGSRNTFSSSEHGTEIVHFKALTPLPAPIGITYRDEEHSHTHNLVIPQVPNPADKVVRPIAQGDEGVLAEQDGLRPHGGLGELGKHYPCHTGLKILVWIIT